MSNRKLAILAVVAALMVLLAVVQSRKSTSPPGSSGPAYLIQGLDPDQIAGITIGSGKNVVKIEKQDNRFVVVNKSGYPADVKQVNDLINKCLDIKTSELFTQKPQNHAELEVTQDKARYVVKFFKDANSVLTGVVIGKSQESGQGAFVRRVDSNDVYLTDSAPWFGTTPMDYVNAELVAAKREDVNSVTVTTPEGAYTLRATKGADGVTMDNTPADKKLKDSDAKSVLQSVTSLRFEDVNTPASVGDLNFDHQYVCRLNNTTEYTLKLAKKNGKTYMRCEAAYGDMTPVSINPNVQDTDQERKAKEAKLQAQEYVKKFNLLAKDWVYVVPDWKAAFLTKKQADLLEDKFKATPAKPAGTTTPAEPNAPKPAAVTAVEPNVPKQTAPAKPPEPNSPKLAEPNAPKPAEPNKPA